MKNTIEISNFDNTPHLDFQIEIDEYVPLRFRSYKGALGVKYIRIGNFRGSLLEFLLDPNSMVVRGFTLTSFDVIHQAKASAELPRATGLPIIAPSENFKGSIGAQRIDIPKEFSVGFGEDFVEIDLGGLSEAQQVIVGGAAEFYVRLGGLVGMRVVGLTQHQVSIVKAQRVE